MLKRSKKKIKYHGRKGHPIVHKTKGGRKYITVRSKGGGVKRLYVGSKYKENGKIKRLKV
jgi:secreted trypsin-like serine protease